MTNKNYRLNTSRIAWTARLPQEDQQLIRWLHKHCKNNDIAYADIAKMLIKKDGNPYAKDSVYQALTGRRDDADLAPFLNAVKDLQTLVRERALITHTEFVETRLAKRIFKVCETARNFNKVNLIIGESHIGKTEALKEFQRRAPNSSVVYLRLPTGASLTNTVTELVDVLNLGMSASTYLSHKKIFNSFNKNTLLLVDEAHQMTMGRVGMKTLEFLREIHDRTDCGIVLSATTLFKDAINQGEFAAIFAQMKRRSMVTLDLPDKPTANDLNDFAKHFDLEPAQGEALDVQSDVIETSSLGRWITILEGASKLAAQAKQPMTWDYVIKSHSALLKLEGGY